MEKHSRISISTHAKRSKISTLILVIFLVGCFSEDGIPIQEGILMDRNPNINYGCALMENDSICNDTISMAMNAVFLNDFKSFSNLTGIPFDSLSCYKYLIDLAKTSKFSLKIPVIQFLISKYYPFAHEELNQVLSENYYIDTTNRFNYFEFLIYQTDFSGSIDSTNFSGIYKDLKKDISGIIQLENYWKLHDYNKLWAILNSIDINSNYFPYVHDYLNLFPNEDSIDNFYSKNIRFFEKDDVFSYTKIYYLSKNNENEKLMAISDNLIKIENATLDDKIITSIDIVGYFAEKKMYSNLRKALLNSQNLLNKFCWDCLESISDHGKEFFHKVKAKYDFALGVHNSHFQ